MILRDTRIYVVEDDPFNIGIISMLLDSQGATVKVDGWGVDTIPNLLEFAPVDVILLDLMLPNQASGYDIYRQIKEIPQLADVPVAIISASDPDVEMNRARDMGLDGFISKPFDFGSFPKRVARLLHGKAVWHED
ncbi:MAG: response regulator [Anaerolineales bacterium]